MTNFEIMTLNIQANMKRIEQLLAMDDIDKQYTLKKGSYGSYNTLNRNNAELRQRLKMLRKDTVALEKEIERGYQYVTSN